MKYIKISGILLAFLYFITSCNEDDIIQEPQLPISIFTFTGDQDSNGKLSFIPVTISFLNNSEFTDSVKWIFGDGEMSTEENPRHTYTENGTYSVSLIAMNLDGSDTSSTEIRIGVAAAPMSLATMSEGITVFSMEYDVNATGSIEGTPTFYVELSTYSDFSQMIEFSDEEFQNPIMEKELSGTGTYQFKELKPGSWYYYRIRQELNIDAHTYTFYSDVKTAKLGSLLAPNLAITTYSENSCVLKLTATINEPPGESLNLTGSDVRITASYSQNMSNPITLDPYTAGSVSQGESYYFRKPGSTIFIRGVYEYKGRLAYSSILTYTTDRFIANLSTKTLKGSQAELKLANSQIVVGDQSGEHIRFLIQDYSPNTLDSYSIVHSSFEYEDETDKDFNVSNTNEFHSKVVLKILEESDTYIIAQLLNSDDMSTDLYYSLYAEGSADIFMSGLIFKAEKTQ